MTGETESRPGMSKNAQQDPLKSNPTSKGNGPDQQRSRNEQGRGNAQEEGVTSEGEGDAKTVEEKTNNNTDHEIGAEAAKEVKSNSKHLEIKVVKQIKHHKKGESVWYKKREIVTVIGAHHDDLEVYYTIRKKDGDEVNTVPKYLESLEDYEANKDKTPLFSPTANSPAAASPMTTSPLAATPGADSQKTSSPKPNSSANQSLHNLPITVGLELALGATPRSGLMSSASLGPALDQKPTFDFDGPKMPIRNQQ